MTFITMSSIKAQDSIFVRTGEIIPSKVYEVTQTTIHFQKSSNMEGPMYSINKTDVEKIQYKNGSKDVFSGNAVTTLGAQDTCQNYSKDGTYDDVYNTQNTYQQNQQQVVQQNQAMVSNYYNSNTAANLAAINYMMAAQSMMYGYGYNYGYSYWPYYLHHYNYNPYCTYRYSPLGNAYYGRGWNHGYGNGYYHNTYPRGGGGFHGGGHRR